MQGVSIDKPVNHGLAVEDNKRSVRNLLKVLLCTILLLSVALIAVSTVALTDIDVDAGSSISNTNQSTTRRADYSSRTLKAWNTKTSSIDAIQPGCETTLLAVRHCNDWGLYHYDDEGNKHCSYLGYERSFYLATLFGDDSTARWPNPSHLFASTFNTNGSVNFRQWETLKPLSDQAGIAIENIQMDHFYFRYQELLQSGELCGRLSVVAMKHFYFPKLVSWFNCSEEQGCRDDAHLADNLRVFTRSDFDKVMQFKFVYGPTAGVPESFLDDESIVFSNTNPKSDKEAEEYGWNVHGAIAYENFDPLTFSSKTGDYPASGTPKGGRWQKFT